MCGGKHTVTFAAGDWPDVEVKHTFSVGGCPSHGTRVKKGPDWKPPQNFLMPASLTAMRCHHISDDEIGTAII